MSFLSVYILFIFGFPSLKVIVGAQFIAPSSFEWRAPPGVGRGRNELRPYKFPFFIHQEEKLLKDYTYLNL